MLSMARGKRPSKTPGLNSLPISYFEKWDGDRQAVPNHFSNSGITAVPAVATFLYHQLKNLPMKHKCSTKEFKAEVLVMTVTLLFTRRHNWSNAKYSVHNMYFSAAALSQQTIEHFLEECIAFSIAKNHSLGEVRRRGPVTKCLICCTHQGTCGPLSAVGASRALKVENL